MKPDWHDVIATLAEAQNGRGSPGNGHDDPHHASAEVARRQAEARVRLLARRVPTLVWSTDGELRVTSCQGAGLDGLELRPEHLLGIRLADSLGDEDPHLDAHRRALAGDSVEYEGAWLGRSCACLVEPLPDAEGHVTGTVGAAVDISELRGAQDEVARSVRRDGLTGLPTRTAFHERLVNALARSPQPGCAVLLLNLDGFKAVNDSLGHGAGDRLLTEVASRLEATVRSRDSLARFAGDEFTVLLDNVTDPAQALRGAERVLACVSDPVEVGGAEVVPQASAGLALARANQSAEELLREAESALLEAKAKGRGRCQVFEGPLDSRALALLRMESELRRALDREEFRAHYEPTVAVKGSKVNGFEVVLWRRSLPRARPGNG